MLPPTRTPKARKRKRRSHHALRAAHTTMCPNCGSDKLPHAACSNCGYVRPGLTIKLSKED
ncbi:MAG: 50S ribosomal protein L32 [Phycisphaera sp.]|nr:50S ribosomal protein L32 [Phycisphaera sp.]